MQKLSKRKTYTPTDASQVCGSVVLSLNKEETPSEQSLKTFDNNLEVNRRQHGAGQNLRVSDIVYVLNQRGNSLMPCRHKKAKQLLKDGGAKVVKRMPFTIQMTKSTGESKQEIKLGIDSGAKFIGFSAVSSKKELISGELVLDNKTSERLTEKAMYRKHRRGRHHWYRPARFNNRKGQELPPSIKRKYETHLNLINRIKKLLPVTQIIVEVGSFDIQKINSPEITGVEYQQGDRFGYENMKSYVLTREKGKCQLCGKTVFGSKINLHHIIQRKDGGTDKANNMALLHEICHDKIHKKGLNLAKNKQFKESAFMNIIKNRFWKDITDLEVVYGYETFCKRIELGIDKSHANDAFVIASGINQERSHSFQIIQKHKNNRKLQLKRKGFKTSIRRQRYKIQPHDLVKINNKWEKTGGCHNYGKRIYVCNISTNINKINDMFCVGTLIWSKYK